MPRTRRSARSTCVTRRARGNLEEGDLKSRPRYEKGPARGLLPVSYGNQRGQPRDPRSQTGSGDLFLPSRAIVLRLCSAVRPSRAEPRGISSRAACGPHGRLQVLSVESRTSDVQEVSRSTPQGAGERRCRSLPSALSGLPPVRKTVAPHTGPTGRELCSVTNAARRHSQG